jgi:hypothetical protein
VTVWTTHANFQLQRVARPHHTTNSGSDNVALVTGLKHYLGPLEAYRKGLPPPTPYREEQPRLDIDNFCYASEDEIFAAAARDGFGWLRSSTAHDHRPCRSATLSIWA